MNDSLETFGRSLIHHGSYNDRAYLMKLHEEDSSEIVRSLDTLASSRGYSKIFAKVPAWAREKFLVDGYAEEARIPGFYPGGEDVCFMGKYFTETRVREQEPQLVYDVIAAAETTTVISSPTPLPSGFSARIAEEADVEEMAKIYCEVFASYPFPIHDPAFLRAAMEDSTIFFGIWNGATIAALSSAEMDVDSASVEMTDFATSPVYRGNGFALFLLRKMEEAVKARGIRALFTIARAYSYGMNITFARNGYCYGGTLTNNTNISGRLESMNVWYKIL
ncbi:MAG: putative beta-lysine N-acetyltransferase [Geobacteraceae bacterium]|nr:putative beta-lysine N-acetyltransferase [Geobacteraceae bacterium]